MAVGDLGRLADNFISRGLGNSGVASRRLQQAQIDDLSSVGKSLAESQAVRGNLEKQQRFDLAGKVKPLKFRYRSQGLDAASGVDKNKFGVEQVVEQEGNLFNKYYKIAYNPGGGTPGLSTDENRFKSLAGLREYINRNLQKKNSINSTAHGGSPNLQGIIDGTSRDVGNQIRILNPESLDAFTRNLSKNYGYI